MFKYGDRVKCKWIGGCDFLGVITYESTNKKMIGNGEGYYVRPVDGTTFNHHRFEVHGNCWVGERCIKLLSRPHELPEDLFNV